MRSAIFCLVPSAVLPTLSRAQAAFVITQDDSSIKFYVKASVDLTGSFDKWEATLTFTSPDVKTGILDVKIQAASVNTGSGMKDNKLKSKISSTSSRIRSSPSTQRKLYRPVPTPLTCKATSPYAELPNPRP